jgi:hypothetical protein
MSKRSSGRFSKYPAINRDVPSLPRLTEATDEDEVTADEETTVEAVEPDQEIEPEVEPDKEDQVIEVPEGLTVPELLEWAGEDEDRKAAVLAAEDEAEKPRKTLIAGLTAD